MVGAKVAQRAQQFARVGVGGVQQAAQLFVLQIGQQAKALQFQVAPRVSRTESGGLHFQAEGGLVFGDDRSGWFSPGRGDSTLHPGKTSAPQAATPTTESALDEAAPCTVRHARSRNGRRKIMNGGNAAAMRKYGGNWPALCLQNRRPV